jgi:hypothetical protein
MLLNTVNSVQAKNVNDPYDKQVKENPMISLSVGQLTRNNDDNTSVILTKEKSTSTTLGKTRKEHLLLKKTLLKTTEKNITKSGHISLLETPLNSTGTESHSNSSSPAYYFDYTDFGIYRSFSYLLDDIDGDGFYQSFSVVFDADVYHAVYADVYAELYLRKDGGPWIHYYSTEVFNIFGESEEDEFEVSTTLEQGFVEGYYDVLIDLYDANSDELLVSHSSDDSNALYALPLESSEYDVVYVTEVIYSNGGSYSLFSILVLLSMMILRYKKIKAIE